MKCTICEESVNKYRIIEKKIICGKCYSLGFEHLEIKCMICSEPLDQKRRVPKKRICKHCYELGPEHLSEMLKGN